MTDAQKDEIRRILDANDDVLRRMSEGNAALLNEYVESIRTIQRREHFSLGVPEEYRQSVAELREEILRRMNR